MNLKPLHRKNLISKLKAMGFEGPYPGGNHEYLINDKGLRIIIPNVHSGKDVPIGVIKAIIRQTGSDNETFMRL